ncbi:GNAT family N-acetyltransferase [Sphingobacterium spiritivorum]|uniref:GNAT family N-acetyltransferase n=1 Tax=Sphingobacterium spiritivorum TaxID=258 RepID=UPI001919FE7D|nr:GNAT family N-acetyltransferase [Sphingobacterium spiritivorum]QQT24784.1 GNAT family N-acetyltransferase [Sphingobacterium spiritivorum]
MIRLVPFRQSNFEQLIQMVPSEELLVQFAGTIFSFPLTVPQLEFYLGDPDRLAFAVYTLSENRYIGHAELYKSEQLQYKICRILIGTSEDRGKGYGSALIHTLCSYAFCDLQAEDIELNVFDWNTAAIHCYQKNGFSFRPEKDRIIASSAGQILNSLNMVLKKELFNKSNQANTDLSHE